MPLYVYVCKNPKCKNVGTDQEIKHSMADTEKPHPCSECGEVMSRKVAPFRFGFSPWDVLSAHIDDRFRDYKRRKLARQARRR